MAATSEQAGRLLDFAREALARALAAPTESPPRSSGPYTVNITLYTDGALRASQSGRGPSLDEAVSAAAWRAARDERFGARLAADDVPALRLDLWIRRGSEPLTDPSRLELGLDGIELTLDGHSAYYKPSVALTSAVADHERLLRKLAKKAGLPPDAWRSARLARTSWDHFVAAPGGVVLPLRRLRPLEAPVVDAAAVEQAARAAAARLLAVQDADGLYLYRYQPLKNRELPGPSNSVRQAGCAHGIAWAAAREHDAALAQSANRAIAFLLRRAVPLPGGGTFIAEPDGRGKLGAIALTLLALTHGEPGGAFERERRELVRAALSLQEPSGAFRCYIDSAGPEADGNAQNFFPGEALVALGHEARRGDRECGDAVQRAFGWYRDHFRAAPSTAFVLWQCDAWRLVSEGPEGRAEHAEFVFELVDWLLRLQLDEAAGDHAGGFADAGRRPNFSTATYTEAVIRAYGVARRLGDPERARRYHRSARLGLGFVLRLQIAPQTAVLFPDPRRAVGGTTRDLADFTIRSDYDQHTLTACLAALEHPALLEPQAPGD
jgi:AMMECR1 domain-containing protein